MFKEDLVVGLQAEHECLLALKKRNPYSEFKFNESKDIAKLREYDIAMRTRDNKIIRFEVKWDRQALKTGNVAIELKCVRNSKADVFVYKIGSELLGVAIQDIHKLLRSKKGRMVYGGDRMASYLKLVPLELFREYSVLIN